MAFKILIRTFRIVYSLGAICNVGLFEQYFQLQVKHSRAWHSVLKYFWICPSTRRCDLKCLIRNTCLISTGSQCDFLLSNSISYNYGAMWLGTVPQEHRLWRPPHGRTIWAHGGMVRRDPAPVRVWRSAVSLSDDRYRMDALIDYSIKNAIINLCHLLHLLAHLWHP